MSEHWNLKQLGKVALLTMGQSPAPGSCNDDESSMPFLQGCAEFGARHPKSVSFCHAPLKIARASSTLISVRAPVGKTNRADRDYCVGRGLAAIQALDLSTNNDFLQYAVEQNVGFLHRRSQGSTFLAISSGDLYQLPVPNPRRSIQDKVAEILLTADSIIDKNVALIAKHQQMRAGPMHDLFTRGLDEQSQLRPSREETQERYQESPNGWIPNEWRSKLLDGIALRGSGHTPSKSFPEYWDGGIKWISLADSSSLDRVYISETANQVSGLGIPNSSAVVHPPGIVVLSRDAGVGKSAITADYMAVSQHFMCWRCGSLLDSHYLYYWLQHHKRDFENIATGSTIPTIGLSFFKKYRISTPTDIEEQKRIGSCLLGVDRYIFSLEDDLAKTRRLRSGLMGNLLTGCEPARKSLDQAAHV